MLAIEQACLRALSELDQLETDWIGCIKTCVGVGCINPCVGVVSLSVDVG